MPRRPVLLLLVPLLATLPGCTMYVWEPKITWWGLERRSYERVEAVARGEGDAVYVRVARNRHETETWKFAWRLEDRGSREPLKLELVPAAEFPEVSTGPVRAMTQVEQEAVRFMRPETAPPSSEPSLLVGLELHGIEGLAREASIYVVDSQFPNEYREAHLPDAPVAWESPNAIGHIAVTPVAVTLDVALLPLYLVGGIAVLIHWLATGTTR